MTDLSFAANALWEAECHGAPTTPVRVTLGDTDIDAAYAVQEEITRHKLHRGARLVGRKIGLTARSVQAQLGVDEPDYGMLFDDMEVPNGGTIATDQLIAPRVEAEMAFVMAHDLTERSPSSADVMRAVGWVVPALEIVDSRVAGWDIRITDTVADNASAARFVLGHELRRLADVDLLEAGMVLERNGEVVSTGAGVACLGSPLNAAVWLARVMARVGRPLRAGDIVLTGALGPMADARPGDTFHARIQGLGEVRVGFAPQAKETTHD